MKRLIIVLMLIASLTGCGKGNETETATKIDDKLMNHFSMSDQLFFKDTNPDVVSMSYLIKNARDYVTEIGTGRNDFFVLVKGTVTGIEVTDYSKEDLSFMENQDVAAFLKDVISYDIYIDNAEEPLSDNIKTGDKEPSIEENKEYYFMVSVSELTGDYSFSVLEIYNFN